MYININIIKDIIHSTV